MLGELVSGELPPEYRELVEEHLRRCTACAAAAASYRSLIAVARRLPPLPLPAALQERLRRVARQTGIELPPEREEGAFDRPPPNP
jgi:anti-sigma factor RsiW